MKGSFDFETYLINNESPAPKPVCMSYYTEEGEEGIVVGKDIEPKLKEILAWDTIVAHNAKFESIVIHKYYPALRDALFRAYEEGRIVCTLIAEQYIINNEGSVADKNNKNKKTKKRQASLAALVHYYFGKDISHTKTDPDAWRLRYSELDGIHLDKWPQEAIDYSIQDSVYTWNLYLKQQDRWKVVSQTSFRADFCLALIANKGYMVDMSRVMLTEKEIKAKLKEPRKYFVDIGLGHYKKGKFGIYQKKLKEYIEERIKNPRYSVTRNKKTGEIKKNLLLKADVLVTYTPRLEIIDEYLQIIQYSKILNSFISKLKKADPVIRTQYSTTAVTGRTTSSETKMYPSTNLQNLPRGVEGVTYDIRNCLIPRKGYEFLSIDYGGLEIASCGNQLKEYFGESKLQELLNSGEFPIDPHSKYASEVKSIEDGKTITYEYFIEHKSEPEYKLMRKICKRCNLSIPGGGGYDTLRGMFYRDGVKLPELKQVDVGPLTLKTKGEIVSEKQCFFLYKILKPLIPNLRTGQLTPFRWALYDDAVVELKNNTYKMYPKLKEFLHNKHKEFLNGNEGYRANKFNIQELTPLYDLDLGYLVRTNCTYTELCNAALMQAPSAEGAKRMLFNIEREFNEHPEVNIVGFVHDELIVEIKDRKYIHRIAEIMIKSMQTVLKHVRINVEAQTMDMWSKKSEDVKWECIYWGDVGQEIKSKVTKNDNKEQSQM